MIQIFDRHGKLKSSGIPGFGTVTNVSSGSLSPLFNTVVNNQSTTPIFSFSKISQSQKLFYASPNNSSGDPIFRSIQISDLPSLTTLYTPVTRTLTINGVTQDLTTNRNWDIPTLTSWGGITGTLSDQTDLQNALDDKQNLIGYTPENVSNKSISITTDQSSDTKYPSVKSVYDFVNNNKTIRRNLQSGNINYCGFALTGSLESDAVWTVTKITVATNGTVTTQTYNNVTWTSVPF